MKPPSFPPALSATAWERQAGALAKGKGVTLGADLKAVEKQFDALDFNLLQTDRLATVEQAEQCLAAIDGEFGKAIGAVGTALRTLEADAGKLEASWRKDPAAKAAVQATGAVARAAAALRSELDKTLATARPALARKLAELREAAAAAAANQPPPDSPERRRVKTRLIDQFRIVKNRPDRKVEYLLCLGRRSGATWLGPTASDSQRPLLAKVLKGDTGFRFYRGECIWEEGGYTFVGPGMSNTLARRIERALIELTGTRYRVRARAKD